MNLDVMHELHDIFGQPLKSRKENLVNTGKAPNEYRKLHAIQIFKYQSYFVIGRLCCSLLQSG